MFCFVFQLRHWLAIWLQLPRTLSSIIWISGVPPVGCQARRATGFDLFFSQCIYDTMPSMAWSTFISLMPVSILKQIYIHNSKGIGALKGRISNDFSNLATLFLIYFVFFLTNFLSHSNFVHDFENYFTFQKE